MRTGSPGFVGRRLADAMEARSLKAASLARIIGITRAAVSQYLNESTTPNQDVLNRLALTLGVKPEYFFRSVKPNSDSPVFERSRASVTKAARMRARRHQAWLTEIVDYVSEYAVLPPTNLPTFGIEDQWSDLSDLDIEDFATETRRYWKLGNGPLSNITLLMEKNGVVVSRMEMRHKGLDAFCRWDHDNHRAYIMLGTDKGSAVRSRFDVAHELAHLLLHEAVSLDDLENRDLFRQVEQQAHRFAGAFLAPAQAFNNDALVPGLDTFRVLKPRWKISIKMMIKRANDLDMVNDELARRMYMNYNRRGWSESEPLDDVLEPEHPTLLRQVFDLVSNEGGLGLSQIAADLPFVHSDIEDLAGLPSGYLDEDSAYWWAIDELASTPQGSGIR